MAEQCGHVLQHHTKLRATSARGSQLAGDACGLTSTGRVGPCTQAAILQLVSAKGSTAGTHRLCSPGTPAARRLSAGASGAQARDVIVASGIGRSSEGLRKCFSAHPCTRSVAFRSGASSSSSARGPFAMTTKAFTVPVKARTSSAIRSAPSHVLAEQPAANKCSATGGPEHAVGDAVDSGPFPDVCARQAFAVATLSVAQHQPCASARDAGSWTDQHSDTSSSPSASHPADLTIVAESSQHHEDAACKEHNAATVMSHAAKPGAEQALVCVDISGRRHIQTQPPAAASQDLKPGTSKHVNARVNVQQSSLDGVTRCKEQSVASAAVSSASVGATLAPQSAQKCPQAAPVPASAPATAPQMRHVAPPEAMASRLPQADCRMQFVQHDNQAPCLNSARQQDCDQEAQGVLAAVPELAASSHHQDRKKCDTGSTPECMITILDVLRQREKATQRRAAYGHGKSRSCTPLTSAARTVRIMTPTCRSTGAASCSASATSSRHHAPRLMSAVRGKAAQIASPEDGAIEKGGAHMCWPAMPHGARLAITPDAHGYSTRATTPNWLQPWPASESLSSANASFFSPTCQAFAAASKPSEQNLGSQAPPGACSKAGTDTRKKKRYAKPWKERVVLTGAEQSDVGIQAFDAPVDLDNGSLDHAVPSYDSFGDSDDALYCQSSQALLHVEAGAAAGQQAHAHCIRCGVATTVVAVCARAPAWLCCACFSKVLRCVLPWTRASMFQHE